MTYCWRTDALRSWELALRMMALACGARRPESLFEWYFVESRGGFP